MVKRFITINILRSLIYFSHCVLCLWRMLEDDLIALSNQLDHQDESMLQQNKKSETLLEDNLNGLGQNENDWFNKVLNKTRKKRNVAKNQ